MAEAVYVLGTLISLVCAGLLLRSFLVTRTRLLLLSSLCFIGLALNNFELLVDLYVVPQLSLAILRSATVLASLSVMLFGLLWEAR
jgi:hypothetical protein